MDQEQEWLDEQLKDLGNSNRINVKPIDLKYEKPISSKEFYAELHEDHLKYGYDFMANVTIIEQDPESGWMEQRRFCNAIFKKDRIAGIDYYRYQREEIFQLVMYISGCSYDPTLYFTDEKEGEKIYNKIVEWWMK